jgi:hypothetical protein
LEFLLTLAGEVYLREVVAAEEDWVDPLLMEILFEEWQIDVPISRLSMSWLVKSCVKIIRQPSMSAKRAFWQQTLSRSAAYLAVLTAFSSASTFAVRAACHASDAITYGSGAKGSEGLGAVVEMGGKSMVDDRPTRDVEC